MAERGYQRFYPTDPVERVNVIRGRLDPPLGSSLAHRRLDAIGEAMVWRKIDPRLCNPDVGHCFALDRTAGPARLKAMISRAFQAGDTFADAMAQDRQDEDFARWATGRPSGKKEHSFATLLDMLVGGGPGMGGSDWEPDHTRLFAKYCDGGEPWEAFKIQDGLLGRAVGVIERDPHGLPGEAEDLFLRAQSALRCLDEIRDALLRRCAPQRFRLSGSSRPGSLEFAIGAYFCNAFEAWRPRRLAEGLPPAAASPSGFRWPSSEWRGATVELHRLLDGCEGVPEAIEEFLERLAKVSPQRMGYFHGLGFQLETQIVSIWSLSIDAKMEVMQGAKPQDLPRYFFVARLAEVFAASTGDIPCFSDLSVGARLDTPEGRWLNLFHAALDITGLGAKADRTPLLKRLGGRGVYAQEGGENAAALRSLVNAFDPDKMACRRIGIDWNEGFLTGRMVSFARRFPVPPYSG